MPLCWRFVECVRKYVVTGNSYSTVWKLSIWTLWIRTTHALKMSHRSVSNLQVQLISAIHWNSHGFLFLFLLRLFFIAKLLQTALRITPVINALKQLYFFLLKKNKQAWLLELSQRETEFMQGAEKHFWINVKVQTAIIAFWVGWLIDWI